MNDVMLKLLKRTRVNGKMTICKGDIRKAIKYPRENVNQHKIKLKVITEEPKASKD
jgi:hypothetical protein